MPKSIELKIRQEQEQHHSQSSSISKILPGAGKTSCEIPLTRSFSGASVVHVEIMMLRIDPQSRQSVALALDGFSCSIEQRRGGREDSGVAHARGECLTDVFESPGELAIVVQSPSHRRLRRRI